MDLLRMRSAKKELVIMKLIDHPHVISLKNVYETDECIFLIMELAVGGTLLSRIKKEKLLMVEQARIYIKQLLSAIKFCHVHHICHRDIKAENILLDENLNIKVGDFGFAEFQRKEKLDEVNRGTLYYCSPEAIKASDIRNCTPENDFQIYDGFKADIWSIGVLIYFLLSSKFPFRGSNDHETARNILKASYPKNSNIAPELYELFNGVFHVEPTGRWNLDQISNHQWVNGNCINHDEQNFDVAEPVVLQSETEIDQNILKDLHRLNYFSYKSSFITRLLSEKPNIERSLYTLLKNFRDSHSEFSQMKEIELHTLNLDLQTKLLARRDRSGTIVKRLETGVNESSNNSSDVSSPSSPETMNKHTLGSWFRTLLGLPEKKDVYMISSYGKSISYVRALVVKSLQVGNFKVKDVSLNKYDVTYINKRVSFRKKICKVELYIVDLDEEISTHAEEELGLTTREILPNEKIIVLAVKHVFGSRYRFYKIKQFIEQSVVNPVLLLGEENLEIINMVEARTKLASRIINMSETDDSDEADHNYAIACALDRDSKKALEISNKFKDTNMHYNFNKELSPIQGSPPDVQVTSPPNTQI